MVLKKVRKALREQREATFTQLTAETGLSPGMLRSALDYWIDRDDVEELPPGKAESATSSAMRAQSQVKCASCPLVGSCAIPQPERPRSCHVPAEGTLFVWAEKKLDFKGRASSKRSESPR
jgi:hypothetical protein